MSAALWKVGTNNAFNTTLDGNINAGDTSITLNSVIGLQFPGVIVIDRVDANNVETSSNREYISFTGITTKTLTGCTRGLGGSTDQGHSSGAKIEEVISITHWNDLRDALLNVLTTAGAADATKVVSPDGTQTLTNKTITSPSIGGTVAGSATYTKPTLNGNIQALTADSDGSTITFNMAASNLHAVTLGGNRTLAVSNTSVGQPFIIRLLQDGTGSRTVTWFSTIKWAGGSAPTLTTTASKADVFGFICTSTDNYDGFVIGQNL